MHSGRLRVAIKERRGKRQSQPSRRQQEEEETSDQGERRVSFRGQATHREKARRKCVYVLLCFASEKKDQREGWK